MLQSKFPQFYQRRQEEATMEEAELAARPAVRKTVYIGNRHEMLNRDQNVSRTILDFHVEWRCSNRSPISLLQQGNIHLWTSFVQMDKSADERHSISHVYIDLHPTFRPSKIVLWEPPFEVRRLGWGIFNIRVTVHVKPGIHVVRPPGQDGDEHSLRLNWFLDFDWSGAMREGEVDFGHGPIEPEVVSMETGEREPGDGSDAWEIDMESNRRSRNGARRERQRRDADQGRGHIGARGTNTVRNNERSQLEVKSTKNKQDSRSEGMAGHWGKWLNDRTIECSNRR